MLKTQSLVKRFTKHSISDVRGPISVVTGKKRRITIFECPNDINAMIVRLYSADLCPASHPNDVQDMSKIADLVLLMIDANFGFEMETFEFLNMLQVRADRSTLLPVRSLTNYCRFMVSQK